jgi:predicted ATPase
MAKLFYSYSHRDARFLVKLEAALSQLKREGVLETWHDRRINPGQEWADIIDRKLEEADIILLLVSPDFLASDYCSEKEMARALERHAIGAAFVVPVILRSADWQTAPFRRLQALPAGGKPITSWRNRDEAFQDVIKGIRSLILKNPLPATTPVPSRLHALPRRRNRYYVGRDDTLALLRERFSRRNDASRIQVLSGLGGYGKTETALEYAYRYREEYEVILWFGADTEVELRNDMLSNSRALALGTTDSANTDAAISVCRAWLESHNQWLAVFDNADDPALLAPFLPGSFSGDVLVTSRAIDLNLLKADEPILLRPLPVEVAASFLMSRTNAVLDAAEQGTAASELATELGGLPLALEQAAACISALDSTIKDYLASYRTHRLALLEEFRPVMGNYQASIATTWNVNFAEVERTSLAAADLLRACAFLVPDRIPIEIFARGRDYLGPEIALALPTTSSDPLAIIRLLRPLRRYSLITYDRHTHSVTIHRLVQEVIRSSMTDEDRELWRRRAVDSVVCAFPIERLSASDSAVHMTHALQNIVSLGRAEQKRELTLLTLLGPALIAANGYASDRVGEVYERASLLLRRNDFAMVRFQTLWGLWAFHYVRGELEQARRLAARLTQGANTAQGRRDSTGCLLEAFRASASTNFTLGRVALARAQFKKATRLYDPELHVDHAHRFAVNPDIVCWSYLAVCDFFVVGSDASLAACETLMAHANEQRHLFSKVYACFWAACSHQLRGDVQRARQAAEDGMALSRQQFPQWDAMNEIVRAWCVSKQENPAEGVMLLQAALEKHERTGARTMRPYFLLLLADVLMSLSWTPDARKALDAALATASSTNEHTWTAEILRRQAVLADAGEASSLRRRASVFARRRESSAVTRGSRELVEQKQPKARRLSSVPRS